MEIDVSGQNLDTGNSFKQYAEKELKRAIKKYFKNAISGSVILNKSNKKFNVKIIVSLTRRTILETSGNSRDANKALEKGIEKAEKRLRRHKKRLHDYSNQSEKKEILFAQETVIQPDENDEYVNEEGMSPVIMELSYDIEEMTTEEAIMKFDLGNLTALMFRNASHQGLNMLYKREDGAIGWVDPRGVRQNN